MADSNIKFIISNNPDNLAAALEGSRSATVEAEYGDVVVEGSVLTMAHHGPRAGQPAPCSYANGCAPEAEVVGLSHFDLDTLGGCAAILGVKPENAAFWVAAEFVDLNGPHKLGEIDITPETSRALYAFWAWSQGYRVFPPRDGSVSDVTDQVLSAIEAIERILADDEELLAAGDEFRAKEDDLNKSSLLEVRGSVIVRSADGFTNHLYTTPDGTVAQAVVALNTKFKSVTVSFADTPEGISACEIVQSVWGELAGGHAGIAGSPRGEEMTADDLEKCVVATFDALR